MADAAARIPLPPEGPVEAIPHTSDTVFNWDYAIHRDALLALYEKGKRLQWNASVDIDWSIDVEPERFPDFLPPEAVNAMLNPPQHLEVRELAAEFHTRIEMRQIGVRDEAKILGGYGSCGRPLCCTTWLQKFEPISIKMAKQQDLSLNPSKLSGLCGRLKCCLRYELPNGKGIVHGGCAGEGGCDNPTGCGQCATSGGGCSSCTGNCGGH